MHPRRSFSTKSLRLTSILSSRKASSVHGETTSKCRYLDTYSPPYYLISFVFFHYVPEPRATLIFIFVQTLDLKGREKFLNQVSCQGYMGCAHCRAKFPRGVGGPRFAIARRFLCPGHPLRNRSTRGDHLQYPAPEMLGNSLPKPNPNSYPSPNPNH